MPPLRMLGVKREAWCEEDRVLAEALQIDEDERCKRCGHYLDQSMDDDMDGWYEVETVHCYGCAARDRHTKEQKEPEPGELTYVVNTREPREDSLARRLDPPEGVHQSAPLLVGGHVLVATPLSDR